MIKLIASDIDGTLVKESSPCIDPAYTDVIRKLHDHGVQFVAASGRQYVSMKRMFDAVKDDIIFITENGSYICTTDKALGIEPMDTQAVRDIIAYLRSQDVMIMTSDGHKTLIETDDEDFLYLLGTSYGNDCEVVDDLLDYAETTIKISVYRKEGISELSPKLTDMFGERTHCFQAGDPWFDFVGMSSSKGAALTKVQNILGITPAETMAFGDNANDASMLEVAGESYAVESAHEDAKKAAKHLCASYQDKGVFHVLEELLADYEKR